MTAHAVMGFLLDTARHRKKEKISYLNSDLMAK